MNIDPSALSAPELYTLVRFCKILSVIAFCGGCLGALVVRPLEERRRFAFFVAGPAFGATWIFGFWLAAILERTILSTWVLGALALSAAALQGVLFVASKEGRGGVVSRTLVLAALVATVALMVWRPA